MNPAVSVIVPTFNRKKLLEETVTSILAQTFREFEVIIVDNMSEDGTEEFVRSLQDPRIKYHRNPNHGIIAVNRNFGIRQAQGKYLAFCDDDDLWLPHKLEKQLRHFPSEGISCVSSDFIPFGDPRFFRKSLVQDPHHPFRDYSYREVFLLNPVISSSVVTRRDLLLEVGGFDENPDFCCIEDWELWMRLCRKGTIRVLSEPLLRYRMVRKAGRDSRKITLNTLKVLEKHKLLGYVDLNTFRKAQGNCFVSIGKTFLDNDDRGGLAYFGRGLIQAEGCYQKLRAAAGILLYLLPLPARRRLLDRAYSSRRMTDAELLRHPPKDISPDTIYPLW